MSYPLIPDSIINSYPPHLREYAREAIKRGQGMTSSIDGILLTLLTQSNSNSCNSSSSSIKSTYTAGVTINAGKAVWVDTNGKVYPFDILDPDCYDKYLGVAETAATGDSPIVIVTSGVLTSIGAGFTTGVPYYITTGGFLSTTPPSSGAVKQVAVGIDSDKLNINPSIHIIKL